MKRGIKLLYNTETDEIRVIVYKEFTRESLLAQVDFLQDWIEKLKECYAKAYDDYHEELKHE